MKLFHSSISCFLFSSISLPTISLSLSDNSESDDFSDSVSDYLDFEFVLSSSFS